MIYDTEFVLVIRHRIIQLFFTQSIRLFFRPTSVLPPVYIDTHHSFGYMLHIKLVSFNAIIITMDRKACWLLCGDKRRKPFHARLAYKRVSDDSAGHIVSHNQMAVRTDG